MLFLQLCGPLDSKKEMAFTPEFNAWLVIVDVVFQPVVEQDGFLPTRFEQRAFVFALDTCDLIYCQV